MKKQYTIEYRKPSMGMRKRQAGWTEGYTRVEAIKFVAECLRENGEVVKIRFDNKEVVPQHADMLLQTGKLWDKIAEFERNVEPGAARRAKLAVV